MKNISVLIALFYLCQCSNTRASKNLANFSINGRQYNKYIKARIPDYGIAGRDGCLTMREMNLDLISTSDSIKGTISDSRTFDPLRYATVQIYFSVDNSLNLITDNVGTFKFPKTKTFKSIIVNYIGYRAIFVDLQRKKNFE